MKKTERRKGREGYEDEVEATEGKEDTLPRLECQCHTVPGGSQRERGRESGWGPVQRPQRFVADHRRFFL